MAAPGSTQQRRDRRRDDAAVRLKAAVQTLLAEGETFAGMTIERLATTAGLSRATFYIYFAGRAELLERWFDEGRDDIAEACERWRKLGGQSGPGDVAMALVPVVTAAHSYAWLLTAMTDEARRDPALAERIDGVIRHAAGTLEEQLARGQEEGWVDTGLDPPATAWWAIWTLERAIPQLVAGASPLNATAMIETLADMAWHLLFTRARVGSGHGG